jgi:transcriptional regulator with XRE-family HTH domain
VDNRVQVRDFLISRRAKISPELAGLPAGTRRRRVPGLRRSEVAALADVSVEYYGKLERGNLAGVSPAVLEAVARALQLDDDERAHLMYLAQAAEGSDTLARPRQRPGKQLAAHGSLQWALDAITAGPAYVTNGRQDLLATNALARALLTGLNHDAAEPPNLARYIFLDPAARHFYLDWDLVANVTVGAIRVEAGRDPRNKDLHDLVGELCTRSDAFRSRWGAHDVIRCGHGIKRFQHPVVGELVLTYDALTMDAEPGLILTVYTAEPDSPTAQRLSLLASWAATAATDSASQTSATGTGQ